MIKIFTSHGICIGVMLMLLSQAVRPALGDCREIWVDQAIGVNNSGTPGTPEQPFKSITYALAVARNQGWLEPWCVYIRPGVYDADPAKPVPEREVFPIVLEPQMVFEGTDRDTCIIDGQHLTQGLAPLLKGTDLVELQIRNLTLRNMNHSQGNGGAIELINCAGVLENCKIEDCQAQQGGGMFLSPRSSPDEPFDFVSSTFSNSSATSWSGGGLRVSPGPLIGSFTDCSFLNNQAAGRGGAFSIDGSLDGSITGCTVARNTAADDRGAGIEINGTLTGHILNSRFDSNSSDCGSCYANKYGGGLYINGSMNGDITSCGFTDNTLGGAGVAYGDGRILGGGLFINTLNGNVRDSAFEGNQANAYYGWSSGPWSRGGGFYVGTLNGQVVGCSFTGNIARNDDNATAHGAGFFAGTISSGVAKCSFLGNSVRGNGGGFYVDGSLSGGVSGCSFGGNQSGVTGDMRNGAGFFVNGNLTGGVTDCSFTNNIAGWAAAFQCNGSLTGNVSASIFANDERVLGYNEGLRIVGTLNGMIDRCRFFGFPTGAVELSSNSATPVVIRDSLFVAPTNTVATNWWGVATKQKVSVQNNTMIGPGLHTTVTPAAVFIQYGTQAEGGEIHNNIIVEAKQGIRVAPEVDMSIHHNSFWNVECIVSQGESCLGDDCDFVDYLTDNFLENICDDPQFTPHPSGTWTGSATYDAETDETTFFDDAAGWADNELTWLFLNPHTAYNPRLRALITANTATTVTVRGDCAAYGTPGNTYEISDYHLSVASPCVDAGDPSFVPGDGETDLDGRLRLVDGDEDGSAIVDMGACEYDPHMYVTAWRSMRLHGGLGELAIELDPAASGAAVVSETRKDGIKRIEVDFDADISEAVIAIAEAENLTYGGSVAASSQSLTNGGLTLVIDFADGLPDGACYRIDLAGVIAGLAGDTDCMVRGLAGDVNGDGVVSTTDMAFMRSKAGQPIDGNERFDVNCDGNLSTTDMAYVRSRVGAGATCW